MKKEDKIAQDAMESTHRRIIVPYDAEHVLDTLATFYESLHTLYDESSLLAQIRKALQDGLGADIVNI